MIYHLIIKELAEEFRRWFACLDKNNEEYITLTVLIEKKLYELIKKEKKLKKPYPKDYNLLIEQDLWKVHYQILLTILLKEYIKLNVNTDRMAKNVKHDELNTKIASAFLNTQTLEII